ncbi:glycosyltransferase family 2 protein [Methylobacterium thuringiense]|uniref:Glycosyltransferase 2-like domain-containing protein n=1 Tax=Methylobacterium thuringiense TaxID=1003091 RepID=A0ABQ4TKU3_9HYPH|nr:glycosyltransferase family 2 protein [Methylobacterium thuringiense]GJE55464.1 hypothetical protein EKPJFOCH_1955 [Methylobacterium thuringiense]
MASEAESGSARGAASRLSLPPEIGFLLDAGVPHATLAQAAALARACGTDAATVLVNRGLMDEDLFYRALARTLGTVFLERVSLDETARYPQILEVGAAPLATGSAQSLVVAPRGAAIARLIAGYARLAPPPAITSPRRLRLAAFERFAETIADEAANDLARHYPEWSCTPGPAWPSLCLFGLVFLLFLMAGRLPDTIGFGLIALGQCSVLAMLALRLAAVTVPARTEPAAGARRLADRALPTYTVLVALYREAVILPRLIHTLARLDYPEAKLDIKILIEADDGETAAALRAAVLPARFEVVVVPPGLPRTKPRALNVGLPLARGELLVVFDAEDQVDPGQLREAASRFADEPPSTACLQGRLVIDNCAESWLTRLFAIEYAGLFDVLLPALTAWRMPTPLGGTSTHFRTRVLRELHGWDAWNVTEDADLGIRLALAGYRVGDLPSPTFEEAPKTLRAWLRQRTRWLKGFMQTSFTHGRRPLDVVRRLGLLDSLCAVAVVPGTVLSALLYPLLTIWLGIEWTALDAKPGAGLIAHLTGAGALVVASAGFVAMWLPGAVGCLRRGWPDLLIFAALMPIYFALVSIAAWLAVFELARHPHRWNKTEHGLSRTSRSGALHLKRRRGP